MIEKIRDRFIRKKLDVDLDFIGQLNLGKSDISWQKIELMYAINGKEVTKEDYLFFLAGAALYKNMYDMMMKCIVKTDFLSHLVNDIESIELCYLMGYEQLYWSSKVAKQWFLIANPIDSSCDMEQMDSGYDYDLDRYDVDAREKRKFKILDAIDKRFPLLLIQFFDKYKKNIVLNDKDLVQFIVQRTTIRASKDKDFEKILMLMDKEIRRIRNIGTFLN